MCRKGKAVDTVTSSSHSCLFRRTFVEFVRPSGGGRNSLAGEIDD
jgi:hypothetical protein